MPARHESSILRPRDPTLKSSDDWPIFVLKSVHVFDPLDPSASPVNLLHAGAYRPLTVRGKLEPLTPETSHLLLRHSYTPTQPIEITHVREFSYGQYEDQSVDLWAAGEAGWYTINPSRAYKDIYRDMVQAIKLLYYAADTYREEKRYSDLDAPELFRRYCLAHPDVCSTPSSAEELFAVHRYFLIASMLDGKEGLQWTRVPLLKHLETAFPDDATIIRQRRAFAMKPPKKPSSGSKRSTHSPVPSNSTLKRKRTPTRPKSHSVSAATDEPSLMHIDGACDRNSTTSQARSTRSSTRSLMQPITATPVEPKQHNESDGDSQDSPKAPGAHKGKSALRPRPSKYVQKWVADGNDADDDETDAAGHVASSTPSSPSMKRKMADDLRARRAKRRNSSLKICNLDEIMSTSADGEIEHDSLPTPTEEPQDVKDKSPNSTPDVERGKNLPNLPFRFRDGNDDENQADVWHCSVDGCMRKIYAASETASKDMIEEHERMHEHDDDERVQLVRRMEAPWLPVGRLMDRVRELAAQSGGPAPVIQRY